MAISNKQTRVGGRKDKRGYKNKFYGRVNDKTLIRAGEATDWDVASMSKLLSDEFKAHVPQKYLSDRIKWLVGANRACRKAAPMLESIPDIIINEVQN